ncbi:MAG: hypothetical protein ACKO3V_15360 [Pirellula sp.]
MSRFDGIGLAPNRYHGLNPQQFPKTLLSQNNFDQAPNRESSGALFNSKPLAAG